MKFKREDGTFDVERFKAAVRIFITAQEILVDNASYPTKEIAENSHIFRTLGLGYANLGSLIMSLRPGLRFRRRPGAGRRAYRDHDGPCLRAIGAKLPASWDPSQAIATRAAPTFPSRRRDNVASMLGVIRPTSRGGRTIQPSARISLPERRSAHRLGRARLTSRAMVIATPRSPSSPPPARSPS